VFESIVDVLRVSAEGEEIRAQLHKSLVSARAILRAADYAVSVSLEHDASRPDEALASAHAAEQRVVELVTKETDVNRLLRVLREHYDSLVD
jgi:hypothetical protein